MQNEPQIVSAGNPPTGTYFPEPQLSAEIKDKLLTEREFYENTMGCFYQDELRAHDRAMRKRLATALEEQRIEIYNKLSAKQEFVTYKKDNRHGVAVPMAVVMDILNGKEE